MEEVTARVVDRPWKPVAAAVALHVLLLSVYLAPYRGDLSALVCLGQNRVGTSPYQQITTVPGPFGDDGQYYYSLAQAPFARHGTDIDVAPARQLRILYPTVCWLLSAGGHPYWLFTVMPAVNLIAIAGMAWLGGLLALHYGRSVWWGFLLPLVMNAGGALFHNFTDAISGLAVVGLLTSYLLRWGGWSTVLWAFVAVFSREQNIAIAGIVAGASLWARRWGTAAGIGAVLTLWLAWVLTLWIGYGQAPFFAGSYNLSTPFTGLIYRWTHLGFDLVRYSRRLAVIHGVSIAHFSLLLMLAVYIVYRCPRSVVAPVLCLGVCLALVGGWSLYNGFGNYTRVFVWVPLGVFLMALPMQQRWPLWFLSIAAAWPVVSALHYV